ncbi:family 2A encapsulin nanocompartment cargo protein cysteine desulfurase [Methylococcus sp. EFPC2]|uniref:family 2A encapsulin nanocompartment cargo protein cysteine desulfurase n=1 Tax=Methylococcus sp. EFPC2 TaxID=2812648 RepID=UPI0019678ECA|nr:family 2A encapsulin nanocompartment cargo protein cysteine desulfurase [Methylococcus sp. EFPC2]QSA98271.1 SufS family cysteine desulfurase [Methylococcus sp. EFPC2]
MTTSPSTSNLATELPQPERGAGFDAGQAEVPAGLPDPATLAGLANAFFSALPRESGSLGLSTLPTPAPAVNQSAVPNYPDESALHGIPALLAGATGQRPETFLTPPAPVDEATPYYFLAAGQPSTPGVLPSWRPDPQGIDPTLSSAPANAVSTAGPRALPGRSSVPGEHLGSTPPYTQPVEVGSLPVAGHVPPASAFGTNAEPRPVSPTASATPKSSADQGSSLYFLDLAQVRPADLRLSPADLGLVYPDLGAVSAPGQPPSVPASQPAPAAPQAVPRDAGYAGSPQTSAGEGASVAYYFLGESRSVAGSPRETHIESSERRPADVDAGNGSLHPGFDINLVRRDFPILQEKVHGKPLIWLDNAATTQKPQAVIDRLTYFYSHENSNIHRAAHELAARATDAYEAARDKAARFLHASSSDEIVFVRGTTEAINLIAKSWGGRNIAEGDEIIVSWLEHHANIVPWQQLCAEKGAKLRVAPVDDRGQILLEEYEKLFNARTKLVSFTQVSNALGTITPAKEMVEIAHRYGARVLVDGAQAVSHMPVDVQVLDCDWYVFSGHKVFGPTGIGVVYGKLDLLNATPPWQGGGNMIQDVTFERTIYQAAPARFEAGTGNIADAVGLGAALDYVERLGMENIARYEHGLLLYATAALSAIPGLRLIGTAAEKAGVLSFVLDGFRTEEVGEALNREGIAVRSGHHCAQPILRRFGLESTVRPSLAFYNTCEEIDALARAVSRIQGGSYNLRR